MPQMMPLFWTTIFMFMLFIMFMLFMKMYFQSFPPSLSNNNKFTSLKKNKFNM